jgi:hypothetical protein
MSAIPSRSVGAMKRSAPVALMATLFVVGCGAGIVQHSSLRIRATHEPTASANAYRLYTHCGIEWAMIKGTFWRAQHPLSDGNGNPPAGWGNPFQPGTLTFTNPNTARFTSTAGTVVFDRSDRVRPLFICS